MKSHPREVPLVNSTFDEAKEEIALLDHYHIGIAVAAPAGLIVPVVKDADKKDLAAILPGLSNRTLSKTAQLTPARWSASAAGTTE